MEATAKVVNRSRLRTINELVAEIKAEDPQSCITRFFVREACKKGLVKHRMSGTKMMVNVESFWAFLNGTDDCVS